MIDTIRIKSPYISRDLYKVIKNNSFRRFCISPDNTILYEFTSKELLGSYDNRIMLKISTEEWKKVFFPSENKWRLSLVDCEPYLEIELSIHKFFLGHNIYGGSNDLKLMMIHFESYLNELLNLSIPDILDWTILRLDYAEVFKIDFMDDFFYILNNSNFPRRKVVKYPDSIYISGSTTTLKMYNKHEEFKKHDSKRLKKFPFFDELLDYSNGILRVEVEIKKRKFEYDYGRLLQIKDYDVNYVKNLYDSEVKKIMNNREENILICEYKEVKNYLFKNFSDLKARSLMSTYSDLSILGEKETKNMMSKSTYYKHRKIFLDSNISWENSDLRLESKVLKFLPYRESKYCLDLDCISSLLLKKAI